ncbi:YK99 [Enterospora canceri]|uniref:YK99 n=1 Tax=Enterospora canceri TaxID=1081671 RepID=A0A1Y1S770_9MICR|nr:YK99 [Enterospora canceri]
MNEIYYQKNDFLDVFRNNTVIIVTGDTGCGKTTMIPQFIYDHYSSVSSRIFMIGVTQPRRLAAVSIASRIHDMVACRSIDNAVGHKIMYENNVNRDTRIKIMTEGVLLKELYRNCLLMAYDTIVLDEVHERSTNIEIVVIFLAQIVKRRKQMSKELKVVLMSATMNKNRFAEIFAEDSVGYFHVQHIKHKVSLFYDDKPIDDYLRGIYRKLAYIFRTESTARRPENDPSDYTDKDGYTYPRKRKQIMERQHKSILVFLPGKSDIYRLKAMLDQFSHLAEILPLHSGMTWEEQQKIYDTRIRKIILSTNIAETSITVPDVFYVIDSGLVKHKHVVGNVVQYKITFVSKQNAIQRMGRAGRTGPGVCHRLYSGIQYDSFEDEIQPQYTREKFNEILFVLHSFGINHVDKTVKKYFSVEQDDLLAAYEDLVASGILVMNDGKIDVVNRSLYNYPLDSFHSFTIYRATKMIKNENVLNMVIVAVCFLQNALEITQNTLDLLYSGSSDFIRFLYIFTKFRQSQNRRDWAAQYQLGYNRLTEIEKLCEYLYRMVQMDRHSLNCTLEISINPNDLESFSKFILYVYKDNIAKRAGDVYVWKDHNLYRDQYGVNLKNAKYVIFDGIQQMGSKKYMKNTAKIDTEWLDIQKKMMDEKDAKRNEQG